MYNNNTFNGYLNQPVQMPKTNLGIKGRPVSSLDEVRAAQIDFDGSVFVFPDFANQRIYTKQINLDGTASLNMYCLTEIPSLESRYVTKEEFENTLESIKVALNKLATPTPAPAAPEDEFNF